MIPEYIKRDTGFTLVEVLIALFILSVGIMAVTGMFITTIKANQFARTTTAGNRVAQNLVEQVKTTTFDNVLIKMCTGTGITNCSATAVTTTFTANDTRTRTGTFQQVSSGNLNVTSYTVSLQEISDRPIAGLTTVTVTVTWSDAYGPHETKLITYMEKE